MGNKFKRSPKKGATPPPEDDRPQPQKVWRSAASACAPFVAARREPLIGRSCIQLLRVSSRECASHRRSRAPTRRPPRCAAATRLNRARYAKKPSRHDADLALASFQAGPRRAPTRRAAAPPADAAGPARRESPPPADGAAPGCDPMDASFPALSAPEPPKPIYRAVRPGKKVSPCARDTALLLAEVLTWQCVFVFFPLRVEKAAALALAAARRRLPSAMTLLLPTPTTSPSRLFPSRRRLRRPQWRVLRRGCLKRGSWSSSHRRSRGLRTRMRAFFRCEACATRHKLRLADSGSKSCTHRACVLCPHRTCRPRRRPTWRTSRRTGGTTTSGCRRTACRSRAGAPCGVRRRCSTEARRSRRSRACAR